VFTPDGVPTWEVSRRVKTGSSREDLIANGTADTFEAAKADILGVAAEMLETLGYDVIAARTGLEALALLRDNSSISILFTDIQMPGMGGEELAGIAAASRPDLRVIFASGSARPSTDAAFLKKPYRAADLARVLPST
jgi:two-component system, cell cycle response regulator CpdR